MLVGGSVAAVGGQGEARQGTLNSLSVSRLPNFGFSKLPNSGQDAAVRQNRLGVGGCHP